MITRIVKITLLPEKINAFIDVFNESSEQIKSFKGCRNAMLVRDICHEHILFTISEWDDESYLNLYRDSSFFAEVWKKAKTTFAEKATAWSVAKIS